MTYEEYLVNVKKGIVTDLGHCPVTPLLLMLQGKWKAQILYELCIHDTARFGLLKRMLKGITNASLTKALRELESDGLIKREQFNEIPPHVEYSLTEKGNDLQPIFYEIMKGGSFGITGFCLFRSVATLRADLRYPGRSFVVVSALSYGI